MTGLISTFSVGDRAIVFNASEWMKTGDLPDGNKKYWQKATVLKTRKDKYGDWLADVKFDSGLESSGHFQRGMEHLKIIN